MVSANTVSMLPTQVATLFPNRSRRGGLDDARYSNPFVVLASGNSSCERLAEYDWTSHDG